MKKWFVLVLMVVAFAAFGDARFVEAPAECHVPYDNGNVGNEFKLAGCSATIKTYPDGVRATGALAAEQRSLPGGLFVIDGQDVRDVETFPGGVLRIETSGAESGTDCTIIDTGNTTYVTGNWSAVTEVTRTVNKWDVDVRYRLSCRGAVAQ